MSFSEKHSRKLRMFFSRLLIFLQCEPCIAFFSPSIVNNEKYQQTLNMEKAEENWSLAILEGKGNETAIQSKHN